MIPDDPATRYAALQQRVEDGTIDNDEEIDTLRELVEELLPEGTES